VFHHQTKRPERKFRAFFMRRNFVAQAIDGVSHRQKAIMCYAFISYCREDLDRVHRLVQSIELRGSQTWMDVSRLEAGDNWRELIKHRISNAGAFVLCVSEAYWNRTDSFVREELKFALSSLKKRHPEETWFFPVLLDHVRIPDDPISDGRSLADYNCTRCFNGFQSGIDELADRVKLFLEDPNQNQAHLSVINTSKYSGYIVLDGAHIPRKDRENTSKQIRPGEHTLSFVDDDFDNETGYTRNFRSNELHFYARPRQKITVIIRDPKRIGFFKKESDKAWIVELLDQ
jgi:hypothetical protein